VGFPEAGTDIPVEDAVADSIIVDNDPGLVGDWGGQDVSDATEHEIGEDPGIDDPGFNDPGLQDPGQPDPGHDDPGQPDVGCVADGDCPVGFYCEAPACLPCDTNEKCGDECQPCEDPLFCKNGKCVECFITECGAGAWCDDGFCQPCTDDDPGHCGDDCEPCLGKFPACVDGDCVCEAGSCGTGKVCLDGDCADCDMDDHCGTDCVKCEAPTAHCLDGTHCVACTLDAHCDGELVCDPDGNCVECVLHEDCDKGLFCDSGVCTDMCNTAQGCDSDEGPDGEKCGKAKIIGRKAALAGYVHNGDTSYDGDNDNLSFPLFQDKPECWDATYDNFFRLYLYPGDVLNVTLTPTDSEFNSMLKLYNGTGCESGGDAYQCFNQGDDGQPDSIVDWTAPSEGWFTVVVDGRTFLDDDSEDYGTYTLQVQLTCDDPNCCCI